MSSKPTTIDDAALRLAKAALCCPEDPMDRLYNEIALLKAQLAAAVMKIDYLE